MVEIRDEPTHDETVQEAAEHAERAGEHRQEMQRRSVQAETAEGSDSAQLEQAAADHRVRAEVEQEQANERAQQADGLP